MYPSECLYLYDLHHRYTITRWHSFFSTVEKQTYGNNINR